MIQCPGCGGALHFDIPTQLMLCDHCGGSYDPASTATMNKDSNGRKMFDTFVFTCPSCGGELLTTDRTDAIGFCPFCGGASMLYDRIHRQWEPEYIIPCQITKEQCKELYVKEAKRSIFTSRKYRDPKLIEGFRGIYMPYWDYQAEQVGDFTLEGEKKGVFSVSSYRIRGNIDVRLDGYGHDACKAFDDRISEDIAPFDPRGHKPFAPGYLSGFYADVGDVYSQKYNKKAIDAISEDTARLLARQDAVVRPHGDLRKIKISKQSAKIPTTLRSAKRTMYPVWFMSYRNKDKITYAAVNGQTGKVSADLPVSPWKILLTVLLVGAVIAASLFFLPSVKANWTLAASALLLVIGWIILRAAYHNAVNDETGLNKTDEAASFKKRDRWRSIAVIVSAVIAFIVAFIDPAYNIISYSGCILMAGELFWIMLSHIRFQAQIAKRRPPQFNKKGAAYDEE